MECVRPVRLLTGAILGLTVLTASGGSGTRPASAGADSHGVSELVAAPPARTGRVAASMLEPEDVWGAILTPLEVQQLFAADEPWWPRPPEFNVPPFYAGGQLPGERFFVAQAYRRLGETEAGFEMALTLFSDAAAASAGFSAQLSTYDRGGTIVDGPSIAEEHRYFYRTNFRGDSPTPSESTVRFRVGAVVARLSVLTASGVETSETLARLARPFAAKIGALLAGHLSAPAMRQELIDALPPSVPGVGPVLGTVSISPETWAAIDLSQDPREVLATLGAGGVTELAFRRYALAADPEQVVEVVLFPFDDAAAARSFLADYLEQITTDSAVRLDPGMTGADSGYALHDDNYELQFIAGRYLADVSCFSPFAETSAACEVPVRQVAEAWFAKLSGASSIATFAGHGQVKATIAAGSARSPLSPAEIAASELKQGEVDLSFVGAWRVLSARLFYDLGGGGSVVEGGLGLDLREDGTFGYGATNGLWSVSSITPDDWTRWNANPYGPTRKIIFEGWQPGDTADGPVEEVAGRIDFVWAIYRVGPPLVSAPGMIQMKFGRA